MSFRKLVLWHSVCVLTCVAFCAGFPAFAATPVKNPLKPPETSSPRATLNSFVSTLERIHQIAGEPDSEQDTVNLALRALRALDLSELPPNLKEDLGIEAALMLKEVLDRVELPPLEEIPGKEEVERSRQDALARLLASLQQTSADIATPTTLGTAITKWTVPNTEIAVARVAEGPRKGEFLFTAETVERAPEFYERVRHLPYRASATPNIYQAYVTTPGRGLQKHSGAFLPAWSKYSVGGQTLWQWLSTLLTFLLLALVIWLLLKHGRRWDRRERPDSERGETGAWRLGTLIALGASVALIRAADWFLDDIVNITGEELAVLTHTLYLLEIGFTCWLAALTLDQGGELLIHMRRLPSKAAPSQLIRFSSGLSAVFLILGILIYAAQQIGLPAYSVVTGLGVGGLAVALAGQEMLKDLFGAVVIMVSRPYRIGDWVVVGDQEGTVESIGFRSTRIRTFYDSLLSIPNGEMASKTIDNMGMRTYRRIYTKLGIRDDTPAERVEAFLEGIKRIIQANPTTRKDYFHVVLHDFGDAGLDIMLYFFVKVPTWGEELVERQRVFLEVVRLAETLGVQLAPNQTIEMLRGQPIGQAPAAASGEELRRIAADFGGEGASARPRGSKIFVAPYEERSVET